MKSYNQDILNIIAQGGPTRGRSNFNAGLSNLTNSLDRAAQIKRQIAQKKSIEDQAQKSAEAANLILKAEMEPNEQKQEMMLKKAVSLDPNLVNSVISGIRNKSKLEKSPVNKEKRTTAQKNWEQYKRLSETNPKDAESFAVAAGIIKDKGDISVHMQKRLSSANDAAQEAMSNLNNYDVIINEIDRSNISGGFFGSTVPEFVKENLGIQDFETITRKRATSVANSAALNNLPMGSASDADVAMAREPMPQKKANKEEWIAWLTAQKKAEELIYEYNNFKSRFISKQGDERDLNEKWQDYIIERDSKLEEKAAIERAKRIQEQDRINKEKLKSSNNSEIMGGRRTKPVSTQSQETSIDDLLKLYSVQ